MKSFSSPIIQSNRYSSVSLARLVPVLASSARDMIAISIAVLAASALIMLFIWAAGLSIGPVLGAGIWALGFIFLARGLDGHGRSATAQGATGVTLLILALLQSSVSPDYIILAGIILAGWVAVVLFRHLR